MGNLTNGSGSKGGKFREGMSVRLRGGVGLNKLGDAVPDNKEERGGSEGNPIDDEGHCGGAVVACCRPDAPGGHQQ